MAKLTPMCCTQCGRFWRHVVRPKAVHWCGRCYARTPFRPLSHLEMCTRVRQHAQRRHRRTQPTPVWFYPPKKEHTP